MSSKPEHVVVSANVFKPIHGKLKYHHPTVDGGTFSALCEIETIETPVLAHLDDLNTSSVGFYEGQTYVVEECSLCKQRAERSVVEEVLE